MNEIKLIKKKRGYYFPTDAISLSITAIFTAIA